MSNPQINRLEWRVRVIMAERGIKTITELRQRLVTVGVEISTTQLGRVLDALPDRISSELLAGFTTVLQCEIGDLLRVADTPSSSSAPTDRMTISAGTPAQGTSRPPRRRTPPASSAANHGEPVAEASITGPKVTALPLPEAGPRRR